MPFCVSKLKQFVFEIFLFIYILYLFSENAYWIFVINWNELGSCKTVLLTLLLKSIVGFFRRAAVSSYLSKVMEITVFWLAVIFPAERGKTLACTENKLATKYGTATAGSQCSHFHVCYFTATSMKSQDDALITNFKKTIELLSFSWMSFI